jgi:hypothetical protein
MTRSSPGSEVLALDDAIDAVRAHPRFHDAVQHMLEGASALYAGNRLLNRVVNDRGRMMGGMAALYLDACSARESNEPGFTVRRFQAFCVECKLCSFGRARALLTMMCFAGYLAPTPSLADRRQRRLVPTRQLIELQRCRSQYQFEALALVSHQGCRALEDHDRPEFTAAFLRHLGDAYVAGFRLLDHAPELSRLAESNAGLLLVVTLFLSALDGITPDGTTVPVSVSALSTRFGVARAHVRSLLADAAAAGLVRRADESATLVVLPRCVEAVSNMFAALFALLLHCVSAAAEEIAESSDEPSRSSRMLQLTY